MKVFLLFLSLVTLITVNDAQQKNNQKSRRQLPQFSFQSNANLPDINIGDINLSLQGSRLEVEGNIEQIWGTFKTQFQKTYRTIEEETLRRGVFIENLKKIVRLNDDYAKGYTTFVQKINPFADMLHSEFDGALNGFNRTNARARTDVIPTPKASAFIPSANVEIPSRMDWRELGAVTPVRSQGSCAGCYAFSAAGAIEGHWFRKTGVLMELSPQNLIDCTQEYGNDGCMGGLMDPAFQYVKDNVGIDIEPSYSYEAVTNQCRYRQEGYGAEDTGFVDIPEGDEEALKNAVATLGPVSAAIDASRDSLQFYSDGVYFDNECKNQTEDMNHAILVVGYGTDPDGKEYWLIKNSYGAEWGIGGYIKLARNAGNHCGIATIASYPLV